MIFHSCVCLWSQVLGTHLFDSPPFQNLIVNGLVLAVCNLMMESSDSRLHNNLSPQLLCEMNVKEELTQHNAFGILVSFFFFIFVSGYWGWWQEDEQTVEELSRSPGVWNWSIFLHWWVMCKLISSASITLKFRGHVTWNIVWKGIICKADAKIWCLAVCLWYSFTLDLQRGIAIAMFIVFISKT